MSSIRREEHSKHQHTDTPSAPENDDKSGTQDTSSPRKNSPVTVNNIYVNDRASFSLVQSEMGANRRDNEEKTLAKDIKNAIDSMTQALQAAGIQTSTSDAPIKSGTSQKMLPDPSRESDEQQIPDVDRSLPSEPLPTELLLHLHRRKKAWTFLNDDQVPLKATIPLEIDNLPVVVPLPSIDRYLVFTDAHPYSQFKVNTEEPVTSMMRDAISDHFPFADGFCLFIDGTLQLIAPNLILEDVSPLPFRFMGMSLSISQCVPIPSSGANSENEEQSVVSSTNNGRNQAAGTESPITKMNNYGRINFRKSDNTRSEINSVAGLLMEDPSTSTRYLVGSSHAAYQSLGGELHHRRGLTSLFKSSTEKIDIANVKAFDQEKDTLIGTIVKTYDSYPLSRYAQFPNDFPHDVCLISTEEAQSHYFADFKRELKWSPEHNDLRKLVNKKVRIFGDTNRCVTVGQYVSCRKKTKNKLPTLTEKVWGSSILYRRLNSSSSIKHLSGAPVVVEDKLGGWTLIGFQSLEFITRKEAEETPLNNHEVRSRLSERQCNLWGVRNLPQDLIERLKEWKLSTTESYGC